MLMVDADLSLPPEPFRSRYILAQPADTRAHERAYYALRRQVFAVEQGLFEVDDRDLHDAEAIPLVALSTCAGMPDEVVGVVRIYVDRADGALDVWYGGRLAVARSYRRYAEVGAALIRAAVGAARGLGAQRFYATVQQANVPYFVQHQFRSLHAVSICGQPHQLMEADLAAFAIPAWVLGVCGVSGLRLPSRRAA